MLYFQCVMRHLAVLACGLRKGVYERSPESLPSGVRKEHLMTTVSTRGTVRTSSRIMAMYHQYFCGKKVRSRWNQPVVCLFGFSLFRTRWILETPGHSVHESIVMH